MRKVATVLSLLGLCLTVLPSVFVFYGLLSWNAHARLAFAGMLLWFVFAPLWMHKQTETRSAGTETR
ncbi:MAG TPA: hypothetical protein VM123_09540 [archaeon]|nr:hypothetical protein [archaeon]